MKIVISIISVLIFIGFYGFSTGSKKYIIGPNDDERKRTIKQKSIIQSWSTLFIFLLSNFLYDLFNLRDSRLSAIKFPELFYLIVLVVSYFIFLRINNRKMSA
ncbi:hypothetical protein MPS01_07640 [Marinilactibacillus psychrotolerans]|uniref:DUF3784 domain-containing protein n=1 Tax=Marinilactibacillus psychrotolerans TaxID=191770 RepID=A0AAV3WTW2_9LACT|nr:hypothetical protein MPS01_07640 [Marinilactibacillus psychrotolerans]GEQ35131.1 hypothetical protein M132T_06390 [Marinilactibacillus psychrotolerans]SDC82738.1 hypothetical protein SAMN04488013_11029 [Marinilactibacillus psychrotolerans]